MRESGSTTPSSTQQTVVLLVPTLTTHAQLLPLLNSAAIDSCITRGSRGDVRASCDVI